MSRLLVFALLLAWGGDALACKCAQRPLAEYFNAAELVFMGELVGHMPEGESVRLDFRLPARAYKPAVGFSASEVTVYTANHSAACGLNAELGAIYAVFASRVDGRYQANSCDGTRIHFARGQAEPTGFEDVPARFVARQLNALAGLDMLASVIANQPEPGNPGNDSLVGLLDIKVFSHGGSARLFESPDAGATIMATVNDYELLLTRESGYEFPSAVVFARIDGWSRLKLQDGRFGWLPPDEAGTFMPYAELPVGRLAYLTASWSGFAWPEPGAGIPLRSSLAGQANESGQAIEVPVNILQSTEVGGMTWFQVEVLADNPCEGGEGGEGGEGRSTLGGWIPAYGADGQPNAWFWSRGC